MTLYDAQHDVRAVYTVADFLFQHFIDLAVVGVLGFNGDAGFFGEGIFLDTGSVAVDHELVVADFRLGFGEQIIP